MKLPVFSFIGVVVFLLIIIFGNHMISRETFLTEYRAKFHIEPKISDDGTFTTVVCTHTPSLVGKTWVPNHARSLRTLLTRDTHSDEAIIYIEQAQPRMCYELHGSSVLESADEVYWLAPTTLGILVGASSSVPTEYLIDIRTLSSAHHPFTRDEHAYQRQVGALYVD